MQAKSLFNPSKLSIADFRLLKGQVEASEEFAPDYIHGHNVETSFELGFNLEEKLVRADLTVKIITDSRGRNKQEAQGIFQFVYIFKVENLEELSIPNPKGLMIVDPGLGSAIASVSYSTARGVLITRLQGTAMQGFILPVIDAASLLLDRS